MRSRNFMAFVSIVLLLAATNAVTPRETPSPTPATAHAAEPSAEERGLRNLTQRAYGVPTLNPALLEKIWTVWEPEWKEKVKPDDPSQIRRLIYERYGFVEAPYPNGDVPMQFVATEKGWVSTCMQCHGGRIPGSGKPMIGMPGTDLDLATLAEDVGRLFGANRDMSRLGSTRGRTNAFVFSLELLRIRNEDLTRREKPLDMGPYEGGDLDAIPWWHIRKKTRLYSDGGLTGEFVRPIMQFTLAGTTAESIKSWEADFKDILAYLRSIEPPAYPWPIDEAQAVEGRRVFERTCSGCHGTYGPGGSYPNRVVPIAEIGTDPVRLRGITREFRSYFNRTWLGEHSHAEESPTGYIAPPLDGIWASAPYFHNGSVPTVYGVLSPGSRPRYFRRIGAPHEYDTKDLGLRFETPEGPLSSAAPGEARRRIIDTTRPGLGNQGHPFGEALSEVEKRQVIEYLKTL